MSVLNDVKKSIQLRLRSQSIEALRGVDIAAECIVHLMEHGCTIDKVTIRRDYVVIEIDQPSDWLKGSIQVRRINGRYRETDMVGRYRETVMVTRVMDCQVQWVTREAHPMLQREG